MSFARAKIDAQNILLTSKSDCDLSFRLFPTACLSALHRCQFVFFVAFGWLFDSDTICLCRNRILYAVFGRNAFVAMADGTACLFAKAVVFGKQPPCGRDFRIFRKIPFWAGGQNRVSVFCKKSARIFRISVLFIAVFCFRGRVFLWIAKRGHVADPCGIFVGIFRCFVLCRAVFRLCRRTKLCILRRNFGAVAASRLDRYAQNEPKVGTAKCIFRSPFQIAVFPVGAVQFFNTARLLCPALLPSKHGLYDKIGFS